MMFSDCASLERDLAAFVDGELRGARVLVVLSHLETCARCAALVDEMRSLGDMVRAEAPADPNPHLFDGLAGAVISRTKAENDESWGGVLRRAREDWHWVMVGAGSVAATFCSTVLLFVLLAYGPKPERGDSLQALTYPATGPVLAMPAAMDDDGARLDTSSVMIQVDDVGPMASPAAAELAERFVENAPTEADLVGALLDIVTDKGQAVRLDSLSLKHRRHAEMLLQEINRIRARDLLPISVAVSMRQMRFQVRTSVSAKGL